MDSELPKGLPFISIIIPVKDEGDILRDCLNSLKALDYPKESFEIIIADGGSSDNTCKIAREFDVKIVPNKKRIVGSGRNAGFYISKGRLIAFTDADCIFDKGWLKNSLKYFQDDMVAGVGGLALTPVRIGPFEAGVGFLFGLAGVLNISSHKDRIGKARIVKNIPGCNSIYRREALKKVMPIDESLLTAEDVDLNFRLRKLGYRLLSVADVIVYHHRRSSPKKLARQFYRYATGRLQAGKKDIGMIAIPHIIAGIAIPLFFLLFLIFYFSNLKVLFYSSILLLLFGLAILCFVHTRSISITLNFILALSVAVFSWSFGFMRELIFPLKDVTGR